MGRYHQRRRAYKYQQEQLHALMMGRNNINNGKSALSKQSIKSNKYNNNNNNPNQYNNNSLSLQSS
jgi:hypothetical protein